MDMSCSECGRCLCHFRIRNYMTTWLLFLVACLPMVMCGQNAIVINAGRHICMKEEKLHTPIKRMETYCKPAYTKHLHMCERAGKYQLCTSFRLVYKLGYREKIHNEVQTRMVYSCCPGWAQARSGEHGCMQPVCANNCENGGKCTAPGRCTCKEGFTGSRCQEDIDECSKNATMCQHRCVNTVGGHYCECEEGFSLADDGISCSFCLTCMPEFSKIVDSYDDLQSRVQILEKQKESLERNVSILTEENSKYLDSLRDDVTNVKNVMADMADRSAREAEEQQEKEKEKAESDRNVNIKKKKSLSKHEENNDHVPDAASSLVRHHGYSGASWGRLRSLSEQIAMLEERLEDCTCKYDKPRWPGT